jgi:hypothetical protein
MHNPTSPLQTITITENTVSRARAECPGPLSIIDRINATSISVTAKVNTSVP